MATRHLTESIVKNCKPSDTGERTELFDALIPGLGLRVSKGAKAWIFLYRNKAKQPRRLTLGRYPEVGLADAREAARSARVAVKAGQDPAAAASAPAAPPAPAQRTLKDVLETYFVRRVRVKLKASSAKEFERALRKDLEGKLGDRPIASVTREDMRDLIDAIADRPAPIHANRVLVMSKTFFSWAVERGEIETSPCDKLSKPAREISRDRALNNGELVRVWKAADALGYPFGPIVKLLILTAQRRDEVADLRWSEIDFDRSVWILPPSRAKNGREHEVALSPQALAVLATCKRQGDLVFTTNNKNSFCGWTTAKARLDKFLMAPQELAGPPVPMAHFTLHDLRRSAATSMAELGIQPIVVDKILNHATGTLNRVAATYNKHGYKAERAAALALWSAHLLALVDGRGTEDAELSA